jgi:hypothetical protein
MCVAVEHSDKYLFFLFHFNKIIFTINGLIHTVLFSVNAFIILAKLTVQFVHLLAGHYRIHEILNSFLCINENQLKCFQ